MHVFCVTRKTAAVPKYRNINVSSYIFHFKLLFLFNNRINFSSYIYIKKIKFQKEKGYSLAFDELYL